MSNSNITNGGVTKHNNPQPIQGQTVTIRTANGTVVRKVQPTAKPSTVAAIVNWLKG